LSNLIPYHPTAIFKIGCSGGKSRDYQREENAIALVSHEPDLGYWTEMLVWGKFQGKLSVKKAGIIGLEVPNQENPLGKCQLFWLTAPKLLL
jgi:phosphohistidine phosphatase